MPYIGIGSQKQGEKYEFFEKSRQKNGRRQGYEFGNIIYPGGS